MQKTEILSRKPAKAKRYRYNCFITFLQYTTRLKYIKSLYTELGKITDIVNRMAMSHPYIQFL